MNFHLEHVEMKQVGEKIEPNIQLLELVFPLVNSNSSLLGPSTCIARPSHNHFSNKQFWILAGHVDKFKTNDVSNFPEVSLIMKPMASRNLWNYKYLRGGGRERKHLLAYKRRSREEDKLDLLNQSCFMNVYLSMTSAQ